MNVNEQANGRIAIVARGPETVINGECLECGRDFRDEPEMQRCPSDDCPSHWERVGITHPDHAA